MALSLCQNWWIFVSGSSTQGGFDKGTASDTRAYLGRGGLGLRGGQACSDGCPIQCLQRHKPAGTEGGYNGRPAPCVPLYNEALLLWCLGHFPQTFPVWEPITPFPTGCLSPSLGLHSKPYSAACMTHNPGWDVPGCSTGHARSSHFVFSSTDHPLSSPLIP